MNFENIKASLATREYRVEQFERLLQPHLDLEIQLCGQFDQAVREQGQVCQSDL